MKSRKHRTPGRPGTRKQKRQFLYNPNDPKKSFDVYIDKNPADTIPIKYGGGHIITVGSKDNSINDK
jgi:hypothetical protein